MHILKRFLASHARTPPRPEHALAVIGDLHGRADLLEEMIGLISANAGSDTKLVFVGDYVDRGKDSASVLATLQALQADGWPAEVICLMGNHEAMMLNFLDSPEEDAEIWLKNGGTNTLASFGIKLPDREPASLLHARDALREALADRTEAWLRALPLSHRSGNILISHAGTNPHAPPEQQETDYLLWGHPDFLTARRRDTYWIAHGHWVGAEPHARDGRISVDTGAYATDRLTAALLSESGCRFIQTRG